MNVDKEALVKHHFWILLGIAFVVFSFANTVWLLLLSRTVQGAGGGTTGVVQAYIGDSVDPRQRARALGWLSASTSAGVMIGPVIAPLQVTTPGFTGDVAPSTSVIVPM